MKRRAVVILLIAGLFLAASVWALNYDQPVKLAYRCQLLTAAKVEKSRMFRFTTTVIVIGARPLLVEYDFGDSTVERVTWYEQDGSGGARRTTKPYLHVYLDPGIYSASAKVKFFANNSNHIIMSHDCQKTVKVV